jgi:Nuclease-related domain
MDVDRDERRDPVELRAAAGRRPPGPAVERPLGLGIAETVWTVIERFLGGSAIDRGQMNRAELGRPPGWWLGRLPAGWHVFHGLPAGDAESIDHLVIGSGGVFTIGTKDLTGTVWVGPRSILHNRRRTDFLPRAIAGAGAAARALSTAVGRPVEVRGVLAILADDWTIKQRPAAIHVAAPRGAKDWILRQPAVLRPREVTELAVAASKPSTWRALDGSGAGNIDR